MPHVPAATQSAVLAVDELTWYFRSSDAACGLRGQGYEWRPQTARTTGDLTTDGRLRAYGRARRVWQSLASLPWGMQRLLGQAYGEPAGRPRAVVKAYGPLTELVYGDPATRAAWGLAVPRRKLDDWLAARPPALDGLVRGHAARLAEALAAYVAASGAGRVLPGARRPPRRPTLPEALLSPGRHHAR